MKKSINQFSNIHACSLALKYSSFLVLHFIILISGSKSVDFAQKFCIYLKFLFVEGTLCTGII